MKRSVLAGVIVLIGAATLTSAAAAAVAPGTYKGSLHLAQRGEDPRFSGDGHRRRQEGHDQGAEVRRQVPGA